MNKCDSHILRPTKGKLKLIGVFLKRNRNAVNSGHLINHWSMNRAYFKDHVCYPCLAGAVVVSWFLIQKVAGSNNLLNIYTILVNELTEFSKKIDWVIVGIIKRTLIHLSDILRSNLKSQNMYLMLMKWHYDIMLPSNEPACGVSIMPSFFDSSFRFFTNV